MEALDGQDYWLARLCVQRLLGVVYLFAFLVAAHQFRPLAGERGLTPVPRFLARVRFRDAPSLFWLAPTDRAFALAAWSGVGLALAAASGLADAFGLAVSVGVWALLWLLYLSFVNVGQTWYGFGWETMLCEAGFLAIFLGPSDLMPSWVAIGALRWLTFRVMFGAGLIKLRGDPCWRDLTCLVYHYETQPLPNPLSWRLHRQPLWLHKAGVLGTHVAQLALPWGVFFPQPVAAVAGLGIIGFQVLLIVSGNLSWLNYLTLAVAVSCLDDRWLGRIVPIEVPELAPRPPAFDVALLAVAGLVVALSYRPARNLFSRRQLMNASFEPLHLVNTYGAFGAITRRRYEVVFEGTEAEEGEEAEWREYEFKVKPGDVARRPPIVAPYHYRLDWLMWFAGFGSAAEHPWIVTLAGKLLEGDRATLGLLAGNPFPHAPPRRVRACLYHYRFTDRAERRETGRWWTRRLVGEYLPPISRTM